MGLHRGVCSEKAASQVPLDTSLSPLGLEAAEEQRPWPTSSSLDPHPVGGGMDWEGERGPAWTYSHGPELPEFPEREFPP